MALFGVKKTHEDDPIRAILAAREIHERVAVLSKGYESRIGQRLSMHTGINTGLVVTGRVKSELGTIICSPWSDRILVVFMPICSMEPE